MLPAIVGEPGRSTVACWCSDRHQTTDMCTIGTSMKPTTPTTADQRARRAGLSATFRSER